MSIGTYAPTPTPILAPSGKSEEPPFEAAAADAEAASASAFALAALAALALAADAAAAAALASNVFELATANGDDATATGAVVRVTATTAGVLTTAGCCCCCVVCGRCGAGTKTTVVVGEAN